VLTTLLKIFNADGSTTEGVNTAAAAPNDDDIVTILNGSHFNSVILSQV
jgi:hypothetical protein